MSEGLTILKPGMHVLYAGQVCEVLKVNDCCARIVPVLKRERVVCPKTGAHAGERITFKESSAAISISPNSEIPILGHR